MIVVIIGIVVAGVGLAGVLTEKLNKRAPVRVICGLAILGALLGVAQQLIGARIDAQTATQAKAIEASRDRILESISGTVTHTEGIVEALDRRLASTSVDKVGEALVQVAPSAREGEEILGWGKGPPELWEKYAAWVKNNQKLEGPRLCLTFKVNAGHNYRAGLSLAYLFTSAGTENSLRPVINHGTESASWSENFLDQALLDWKGVDYVLFNDTSDKPLAYAPARAFASELLLRVRLHQAGLFEQILNHGQSDVASALSRAFPSVRQSVVEDVKVPVVAKSMLENKWSECLSGRPGQLFLVSLARVVRAAA